MYNYKNIGLYMLSIGELNLSDLAKSAEIWPV